MTIGRLTLVLATFAAFGAAGLAREARGDLTFPTGNVSVFNTGGGSISTAGNPTDANTNDGVYVSIVTNTLSVANQQFFMTLGLPTTTGGNTDLVLWVGSRADASVALTQIVWHDTGSRTATKNVSVGLTAASPGSGYNRQDISGAADLTTYTVTSGFVPTLINRVDLSFRFTNAAGQGGLQLDVDAVSNPEPATLALFGLGGLGLGAVAWRRRRAEKASK